MKRILTSAIAALVAVTGLHAQQIVIKGSDTLGAKLVPQLAEAYKASHPGTTFSIAAEGSTTGIAAIIDGTADIGMASRRATASEISTATTKGVDMHPTVVCFDGIAVVVNSANPIAGLNKAQIESIFTGAVTDWSAVGGKPGPISVYTRNTSSGTYSVFKELAMSKKDYAPASQKLAGNEQITAEVGKNPNGIGYVGIAYINAPSVKDIPVNGVRVSKATVLDHTYPLARPTFYYTNGAPKGAAADFLAFTLSAEGKSITDKVGFVALK